MFEPENVVELRSAEPPLELAPRVLSRADWRRFEAHVAEIFEAFGMPLGTPGT